MKKIIFLLLTLCVIGLTFVGCGGISQEDYDKAVSEKDSIKKQVEVLEKEVAELEEKIAQAEEMMNNLSNGNFSGSFSEDIDFGNAEITLGDGTVITPENNE